MILSLQRGIVRIEMVSQAVRAIGLCALLAACSGAHSSVTQEPPNGTAAPVGSDTAPTFDAGDVFAGATDDPIADLKLPDPTLFTIDDIVAAIDDPTQAGNVVVSMLAQLGIGLYRADGTAIRPGTERSDADLFMFEPEARGLAEMLRSRGEPEAQLAFRDFHDALVGLGYAGSVDELVASYADAYAADPDALIARLIGALATVTVDAELSPFAAWLLLLDGFVPPNAQATASALAGGRPPSVDAVRGWGLARSHMRVLTAVTLGEAIRVIIHIQPITHTWQIRVHATSQHVHERHAGQPASSTEFVAELGAAAMSFTSPISGQPVVPALQGVSGLSGIRVAWQADQTCLKHGTLSGNTSTVDQNAEARVSYEPQAEAANGQGMERREHGIVHAGALRSEILVRVYGDWAVPYAPFMTGFIESEAGIDIFWHEIMSAMIRIDWTEGYAGIEDRFTFLGSLTTTEGDPATGAVIYKGVGSVSGSRAGWAACNPGLAGTGVPSGTVPATFQGFISGPGKISISANADFGTSLSGVSTAPMEVNIEGGAADYRTSVNPGECQPILSGDIVVQPMTLPNP